jgi:hypothetical protein
MSVVSITVSAQMGNHCATRAAIWNGGWKIREIGAAMTTKATLNALERIFAAEIEGRLPFQSKAKIFERLCDDGLVAPMERRFGGDRFGAIVVKGYELTHVGRLLYCSSCDSPDET